MGIVWLMMALSSLYGLSEAKRYCMADADCDSLGKLQCVKSHCSWGVCGCPAGYTAKYLGSGNKFGCVPNRKIGERCSPSNEDGACIAPNSLCDMDTGKCVCHSNFREAWGGEACVADLQPGETCDPSPAGSSDLQKCSGGSLCPNTDFESRYKRWGEGLSAAPPTCACQDDMRLSLMFAHPGYSYWLQPMCVQGRISDSSDDQDFLCLQDDHCPRNAECVSMRCRCKPKYKPNYDKNGCVSKEPTYKNYGEACSRRTECDPELGMTCGDGCEISPASLTCVCGIVHHNLEGTNSCVPIKFGSRCHGDFNCQGFSTRGVCVNGRCTNGADHPTKFSCLLILGPLLVWTANY